jgi:hypothetical protein
VRDYEEVLAIQPGAQGFRICYRVTRKNPPVRRDFLSNEAKGRRPLSDDPTYLDRWRGISVYDTKEWAREQARGLPAMGRFLAELWVPVDSPIRCEQTGRDPHHFTLWAASEVLMGMIRAVEPV